MRARALPRTRLHLEHLEPRTLLDAAGTTAFNPTRILVRFNPVTAGAAPAPCLAGTTVGPAIDLVPGLHVVQLAPGVTVAAALAAYQACPQVLYAEPDGTVQVAGGVTPNDPRFGSLWALNNTGQSGGTPGDDIHAEAAWATTTGSGRTVVAVIDTGVDYNHPDLYQNIWINQAEIPTTRLRNLVDVDGDGLITFRDLNDPRNQGPGKITDVNHDGRIDASDILAPMVLDANGNDTGLGGWAHHSTQDGDLQHPDDLVGWNFVTNSNNPFDDRGHGTHVAGTIGAMGDNGVGVTGINWRVQIMPLKFLDSSGSGTDSGAVAALNYAVRHGAAVSNNSWTGGGNDQSLYNAIAAARAAGHIYVAAAGNDGSNTDLAPAYPADFPLDNVVSVAATDRNDHLASFSNYGAATVDLAAPGVDILSTTPSSGYTVYSGTSMAAPQVTGVLALVRDLHPDWTYRQVIDAVLDSADPVPGLKGKTVTGGRLDAAAAVNWLSPDAAFVQQVYRDVLGRPAETATLNAWAHLLATGLPRAQLVQAVWNSAEHRGRQVDRYYLTYLHRPADPPGRASWVQALLNGVSEDDVIRSFLTSPEYLASHGSDQAFVNGLFQDVLGRSAGAAEQGAWLSALQAGVDRSTAVEVFLTSPERYRRLIHSSYTSLLRRSEAPGEAANWLAWLQAGLGSPDDAALAILASDEYYAFAGRGNHG
jgi:subtilisin family serine protease